MMRDYSREISYERCGIVSAGALHTAAGGRSLLRRHVGSLLTCIILFFSLFFTLSCSGSHEHVAPAVYDSDSLPFMTAHGISNLISDSGVISYKIVAEDWCIYEGERPRWTFLKGLFLEKFDTTFHVEWHVQSDTAYCHNNRTWELRGRVVMLNRDGTLFRSEELFWDMQDHQMWSTMFMSIKKPDSDQMLEGYNFRSDETMTHYRIYNSNGFTPMGDNGPSTGADSQSSQAVAADTTATTPAKRPSQADSRRGSTQHSQASPAYTPQPIPSTNE